MAQLLPEFSPSQYHRQCSRHIRPGACIANIVVVAKRMLQKLIVVHVHKASSIHQHASACKACIIVWSSCLNHQTSSSIDWNQSHLQLHCFLSFTKDPADNMPCATIRHIIGWLEERWHDVYPMAHHHGHQWMCTSVVVYLAICLYHLDIWTVLIQLLESC